MAKHITTDRDYALYEFAAENAKLHRDLCRMGLQRSSLPAWVGFVRSRVAPIYRSKVERADFNHHEVTSAANMLKVYFEDYMAKAGLALPA